MYCIDFNSLHGQIILNKIILITKPQFGGKNYKVFEYLYKNPNQEISIETLKKETGLEIRDLQKIIEGLKFTKNLKEVFFRTSKSSVLFRNPITADDLSQLQKAGVKPLLFSLRNELDILS